MVVETALLVAGVSWAFDKALEHIVGDLGKSACHEVAVRFWREVSDHPEQPVNYDIARAVRGAELDALERLLSGYGELNKSCWELDPVTRPLAFQIATRDYALRERGRLERREVVPEFATGSVLTVSIETLLSEQPAATPAGKRAEAFATFATQAVLVELAKTLHPADIPEDFITYLRDGAGGAFPCFLDLFGAGITARLMDKEHPGFRNILAVNWLADLKLQGFEVGEALVRLDARFGQLLMAHEAVLERQEREAVLSGSRHTEAMEGQTRLERLVIDAAGSGAASVQAMAEIRNLLRPGIPEIDKIPAEQLPHVVNGVIEGLQKPAVKAGDFFGAIRQAITEAQGRANELAFADAAEVLDAALAQSDAEDRDRARGRAALLSERGRIARLQLHYREAAAFHMRAGQAVALDTMDAWRHALAAANALFDLGSEFGDNAALVDAIALYRNEALPRALRENAPLDWALTQMDLGNALRSLGERESGTVRLDEAVCAFHLALQEFTRDRTPLQWAVAQMNLGNALRIAGERDSGMTWLEEA